MKLELILLENPIIVSDEPIMNMDAVYEDISGIYSPYEVGDYVENPRKIIAGLPELPQIDWNGLEDEFGYVDVENLAKNHAFNWYEKEDRKIGAESFIEGFKKAQELNDKKFSLEDISEIFVGEGKAGGLFDIWLDYRIDADRKITFKEWFNLIKSLSQPKSFKIEVEMEDKIAMDGHTIIGREPKFTDGKVKITKKL